MILSCFAGCSLIGGKDNTPDDDNTDTEGGGNNDLDGPPQIGGGGEDEGDWWENIAYDETDLMFMMTLCSNDEELSSGCERYLAGTGDDVVGENIDDLVAERNDNAYELTKVNVTYEYYDDNAELYGFSKMFDVIETECTTPDSETPDMYCNWMTDLLICSLKGCFANLYSKTHGEGDFKGDNHFNLKNEGYMSDLMGSLTLSTSKIYVVASDYFIDLIRAFFVVPVNVKLFNEIAPTMYPDIDNPTIDDFFKEVKPCDCTNEDSESRCDEDCEDGGWTYERLMEFSDAIYQDSDADDTESINDRLGFALGHNGLPAAGLIYTSSVTVIHKEWNETEKKYNYYYPQENEELYNLFGEISDMMEVEGIHFVTEGDANKLTFEGKKTPLLAIRNQFTSTEPKLLFGGIVLVGSLEYETYQNMKTPERGGFGVVPVPVYREGDDYLTQIHVVGRAGAIRESSTKFVQCSAFLHYQSSNSLDIKNEYYDYTLVESAAGGDNSVEGNVDMLKYIRQNVRTSFDKLFEDAVGFMFKEVYKDSVKERFHNILCDSGYVYDGIETEYKRLVDVKTTSLQTLEKDYSKLPS